MVTTMTVLNVDTALNVALKLVPEGTKVTGFSRNSGGGCYMFDAASRLIEGGFFGRVLSGRRTPITAIVARYSSSPRSSTDRRVTRAMSGKPQSTSIRAS